MQAREMSGIPPLGTTKPSSPRRKPGQRVAPFIGPLLLIVIVGFNLPVLYILGFSFFGDQGFTLANYQSLVSTSLFAKVLGNTVQITFGTTVTVAVFGYILAYWIAGLHGRARSLALAMVIIPFWLSVLVRTYAWIVILGNGGVVNRTLQSSGLIDAPIGFLYNSLGVIIGMANVQMPLLVLPLYAAMTGIDKRHMQAAASLGASSRVIFWRVFFPQTIPALSSGILLVLILCLGFYITPAILGGGRVPMIANMLDVYINQIPRWGLASAISAVLFLITLALFAAYRKIGMKMEA